MRRHFRRLAVLAFLLLTMVAAPRAAVLNEILYAPDPASPDPLRSHEWLEILNTSTTPLDLSGWTIRDRSAVIATLPSVLLPANAYLVVHLASGANDLDFSDDCGAFYTGA